MRRPNNFTEGDSLLWCLCELRKGPGARRCPERPRKRGQGEGVLDLCPASRPHVFCMVDDECNDKLGVEEP